MAGCTADGADAAGKAFTVTAEYTMLVDAIYSVTMGIIMTQNRFLPFPKTQLNKIAANPIEDVHTLGWVNFSEFEITVCGSCKM